MPEFLELTVVAAGTFISMCMLSTLYGKGNPLYSFAEESYLGFGTGLSVVMAYQYIWNTGVVGIQKGDLILIGGIILGILTLTRLFPQYAYIARIPLAISIGNGLALNLRTTVTTGLTDQIRVVMFNLMDPKATQTTLLYRWTIAITLICMLTFFLYTIELKGALRYTAQAGEVFMYIAFGAIFAQTFMGRLGLFTGFMQQYMTPNWKTPYLFGSMALVLAVVIILDKTGWAEKLIPQD